MNEAHTLTVALWRWTSGNGVAWFFVTIDGPAGEALSATALMRRLESGRRAGWGSVKVEVTVGDSTWATSAFPSKDTGWIVPVKAAVRKAEGLTEGESCQLDIRF
ncbi:MULTISPECIES: DUF1905 domain-containing protein [Novosphingobium]|uniref:DUF1905 domain-containing protein n=1 Tax=Novosphingobium TaxID=165696 RepID=UPI001CD64A33|nr:DUF1905 domain-containing protein [Novosphingobium percolationis]